MKSLLIGEYRDGAFLESTWELLGFADRLGGEAALFIVGSEAQVPPFAGTLYLADVARYGECDPDAHKLLVLEAVRRENPDRVIFLHSSYGWDLAPRVAMALGVAQISEITGILEDGFELGCCNAKMRRSVKAGTPRAVLTVQAGAFQGRKPEGSAKVEKLEVESMRRVDFSGYELPESKGVDLGKAEVIVSAGRGVGKKDNIAVIEALAKALGGELGASRPVVDAGWVEKSHQVGTTGQTVAPKLYVACGISGAIQHLAGMRKSDFILAINKDRDAPIGEVADALVVADLMQFVPALTAKLAK